MKKTLITILIIAATMPLYCNAQSIDLTEAQKEEMSNRIKDKLEAFLSNLAYIASKDSEVQDDAIRTSLALFIGKGEPYTMPDEYGVMTNHDGVTMQTASIRYNNHGKPYKHYNRPVLMSRYKKPKINVKC